MPDTIPQSEPPVPSAQHIQRRHRALLTLIIGVLSLALLAFGWSVYARQRAALWWTLSSQGEQLQLAVNSSLDVARIHVTAMRQTVERGLRQPLLIDAGLPERLERRNLAPLRDAPWDRLPQDLVKEVGAVHVGPAADGNAYRRDLPAALGTLAQVQAAHSQYGGLLWSYFYDAQQQWRWVYPAQSRETLLTATGKPDMGAALASIWDAAGTTPLEAAGPARNPQKELVWTTARTDPLKKVPVISVLAPVYAGDTYVGLVGADMAVDMLHNALVQHSLPLGQAWVVDGQGRPLASGKDAALPAGPYTPEQGWLRFVLRGTDWSLLVYAPPSLVARATLDKMLAFISLGVVALLALAGSCIWLARQFSLPALQLADYLQNTNGPNIKRPPPVPAMWKPWFDRVARLALQRRDQVLATHQRTSQLEGHIAQNLVDQRNATAAHEAQMAERAGELRSAYAQLSATLADLQAAQGTSKKSTRANPLPE